MDRTEIDARLRTSAEPGRGTTHVINDYELEGLERQLTDKEEERVSRVEHEKGAILVVDDSMQVCRTITEALSDIGYHAEFVQIDSGRADGLGQVGNKLRRGTTANENFDIILMDVDMPSPNNGPSILLALDGLMHRGDLPYASLNFFTGQEDTERIEEMLASYNLNEPCGFYLKRDLTDVREIKEEFNDLVTIARRTRDRIFDRVKTENQRDLLYFLSRDFATKLVKAGITRAGEGITNLVKGFYKSIESAYAGVTLKAYPASRLVQDIERNAYVRVDIKSRTNEVIDCNVDTTGFNQKSIRLNPAAKRLPDVIANIGQQISSYTAQGTGYNITLVGDEKADALRITFNATLAEGRDYRVTAKELLAKVDGDLSFLRYVGASVSPTQEMLDQKVEGTDRYRIPTTQQFKFTILMKNVYTS